MTTIRSININKQTNHKLSSGKKMKRFLFLNFSFSKQDYQKKKWNEFTIGNKPHTHTHTHTHTVKNEFSEFYLWQTKQRNKH